MWTVDVRFCVDVDVHRKLHVYVYKKVEVCVDIDFYVFREDVTLSFVRTSSFVWPSS